MLLCSVIHLILGHIQKNNDHSKSWESEVLQTSLFHTNDREKLTLSLFSKIKQGSAVEYRQFINFDVIYANL
jgi:hypothetical protein